MKLFKKILLFLTPIDKMLYKKLVGVKDENLLKRKYGRTLVEIKKLLIKKYSKEQSTHIINKSTQMKVKEIQKLGKGGLIKNVDLRDYRLEVIPTAFYVPPSFSIKDKIGQIKFQGSSGSCVSQAVAYYAEVLNKIETKRSISMSARYLYSYVFQEPMGSYIKDNMARVCNEGIAEESELPSIPTTEEGMRSKTGITPEIDEKAKTYIAKKYVTWDNTNVSLYKQAIMQGSGAVVVSWGNDICWQFGDIQLPYDKSQMKWSHGILLIGFDDNKKCFEFVNSWGIQWGYGGFGRLPYAYVEQGYVSNPMTLVDVPNNTYGLLMKLIGLYQNIIRLLLNKK